MDERSLQLQEVPDLAEIVIRSDFQKHVGDYLSEIKKTICIATKAVSCCFKWFDNTLNEFELENSNPNGRLCDILNYPDLITNLLNQKSIFVKNVREDFTVPDTIRQDLLKENIEAFKSVPIISNGHVSGAVILAFSQPNSANKNSEILESQLQLIQKIIANFQSPSKWFLTNDLIHLFEQDIVDGILITDSDSRVIYADRLLEKLFRKKINQFLGMPLSDANSRYGGILQKELEALKKHFFRTKHIQFISQKGRGIYWDVKGSPLKVFPEENYFLWMIKDVTKKIEEEKSLEKWRKNTEEFVYTISHDLKAPIISIEGYISLLMVENIDELSGDGKYYIDKIQKNVQSMKQMIQDLLELSRIRQDKNEFKIASINSIIGNVLDEFHFQIEKKQVELELPNRFPRLKCNPGLVQMLFSNLISNAIKFMGDQQNPRIAIKWKRNGSFVKFFVSDNGIGINPKSKDRIFDVFYRLQRTREVEGSGVGLAIVKKIVEVHNGNIEVESDVGKGTTFIVSFPT